MVEQKANSPAYTAEARFFRTSDGTTLFISDTKPAAASKATLFIISGITGINHRNEKELLDILGNKENRVVIVHPRGTGYSEGKKGDIENFITFIDDYTEIIKADKDYGRPGYPFLLFGHSMSAAIVLAIAGRLRKIHGVILVNPPYLQKKAKGMSPSFGQYLKYAFYMLFAKHKPVVNMAGDPSKAENEEDRQEAEERIKDPLLTRYFSMYYMTSVQKLLKQMPACCKKAAFPLLLIYGLKDVIVDKTGCDILYNNWKHPDKTYLLVEEGTHGKSTVIKAAGKIRTWINRISEKAHISYS